MQNVVFLTGATGLLGGSLIPRILKADPTSTLVLLVRGQSDIEAADRIDEVLLASSPEIDVDRASSRIQVVRGDITLAMLGLSEPIYRTLAEEVTHIIHSAASVKFQLPLASARAVNRDGTENVMALAKRAQQTGKLKRIAYISTAYVSGKRRGTIYEDELDCGQEFANTYEQTKFESELLVRRLMGELPITIFRPSIIVGDSKTGRTTAFNVLYFPLKLIYRGMLKILPGSESTPMDVVPVDYVSDVIEQIFLKTNDGIGRTYHLTAGKEKATTAGEIVELAVDYFNEAVQRQIPHITFLPLPLFRAACRIFYEQAQRALDAMEAYEPYLRVRRIFDNTRTSAALRGTGIITPEFRMYYQPLLQYCIDADWGKQLKIAA